MKLKRLIVHGFKSFKDRTVIHFDDGITGIVGPNGCGKSNIVDALFWVMGEQSAKHLRGSSMKDVIFSGSSKYNPASWAEVSLVLENDSRKHIHIGNKILDPAEIQLTRKLYRNGESDYRINGTPCRLKDIQEVFMDTGAGAKSYSIIAQGEINKLVQAKPEERQSMIEEVAGITKFKLRKRDSLRKIGQTEINLGRLQDLQSEVEKNISTLKAQAAKAEKAVVLREKIERNDVIVGAHKVYDNLTNYRDSKQKLSGLNLDIESWQTSRQELEISLEKERLRRDELSSSSEDLQSEYNVVSNELATSEERISSIKRSKSDRESLIETRVKEREELIEELESRGNRLKQLELEYQGLIELSEEDQDFSSLEERVENLKDSLEDRGAALSDINEELKNKKDALQKLEQRGFNFKARLDELSGNLEDISKEIEELEDRYSGVSTELSLERENLNRSEQIATELSSKEIEIKEKISELSNSFEAKDIEAKKNRKEFITVESQLNSLEDLDRSLEGVKEGAREFLNDHPEAGFQLLGSLIECDDKYTKAVQASLADFMDLLVPAEKPELFIEWLKNNRNLGADVLLGSSTESSSSEETIERLEMNGCVGVHSLSSLITTKEEYKDILASFLSDIYIVDNLDEDLVASIPYDLNYKALVSLTGCCVIRNISSGSVLSVFSNSESEGQGRIARNNKIGKLRDSLESKRADAEESDSALIQLKDELLTKQEEYDILRNDLAEAKASFAAKQSSLASKLENFKSGTGRLEILKNRKEVLSKQKLEALEQEELVEQERDVAQEESLELEDRSSNLTDELSDLRSSYDSEKEELIEKQIALKSMQDRLNSTDRQVEDIKEQCTRLEGKIDSNVTLVLGYTDELGSLVMESEFLADNNQDIVSNLKEKTQLLTDVKEELLQLVQNMQVREDGVKKINKDVSKAEKSVVELEIKLGQFLTEEEQAVKNIFEKYRIDLRESIGSYIEYTEDDYKELNDIGSMYYRDTDFGPEEIDKVSYEFTKLFPNEVKRYQENLRRYKNELLALGDVNWQAIEEYRRQKLRYDFLREQEIELKKSLDDLKAAIDHIDQKSKERFQIAFAEVNSRFEKVFPIIFGGGSAKLELVQSKNGDEAEMGVDIVARPPGKKMQNINLMSGGEKALTAVSLIFSIFLVKPSPFCLLDEVDAPLDDANVGRFIELLKEMSSDSQFILITHNKKTMELNDTLYGVTMQEPGVSKTVSVQLH